VDHPRDRAADRGAAPRRLVQRGLFGPIDDGDETPGGGIPAVASAEIGAELRALANALPTALRLGTSSWNFSGWRGLVYAPNAPKAQLSRHGLAAYAQHPLLRAVGIDRTFYAPIVADEFAGYAAQVPARFRFLVKGFGELLQPLRHGSSAPNPRYLDAAEFTAACVDPARAGLGERLGTLLLQFPPQGPQLVREPATFAALLRAFLLRLPRDVPYAIELRDEALLTTAYREALAAAGARHAFVVHPRMPSLARQMDYMAADGPLVLRWMLHRGRGYEAAVERYEPFDRIVDPDPEQRTAIAALAREVLRSGREVTIIVNNKAEGSSPCSVVELARALRSMSAPGDDEVG
jgi:uncharacterized protein YecE (DUF72 family)